VRIIERIYHQQNIRESKLFDARERNSCISKKNGLMLLHFGILMWYGILSKWCQDNQMPLGLHFAFSGEKGLYFCSNIYTTNTRQMEQETWCLRYFLVMGRDALTVWFCWHIIITPFENLNFSVPIAMNFGYFYFLLCGFLSKDQILIFFIEGWIR